MMSCQMKRFFSGAVRDEEEVSPVKIGTDSYSSDCESSGSNAQPISSEC